MVPWVCWSHNRNASPGSRKELSPWEWGGAGRLGILPRREGTEDRLTSWALEVSDFGVPSCRSGSLWNMLDPEPHSEIFWLCRSAAGPGSSMITKLSVTFMQRVCKHTQPIVNVSDWLWTVYKQGNWGPEEWLAHASMNLTSGKTSPQTSSPDS